MVLVDNGASVNVLPLKTALKLGIKETDLTPTSVGVQAFDGTKRRVLGSIQLVVGTGPIEKKTEFQVLDRESNFNFLLGRPWIHATKALPLLSVSPVGLEMEEMRSQEESI